MNLPERVLKKLRCSECNHMLSVLPIHSYENGNSVCGRCPLNSDQKPRRNICYEAIAQGINFPCLHTSSGCKEALLPAELQLHEQVCDFKRWMCPQLSSNCKWQGMMSELENHYEDNHEVFILGEGDTFPFNNVHLETYILRASNEVFLLQYQKTSEKMLINVSVLRAKDISQSYNYSLFIFCKAKEFVLNFSKRKVQVNNGFNNIDLANFHAVDVEGLKNLKDECVEFKVLITKTGIEKLNEMSELNQYLLKYIECSDCLKYITPPIYNCTNNHVICKACKDSSYKCIVCKVSLGNARHNLLEDISEKLFYNCKNKGCKSIYAYSEKINHEYECPFLPQMCPFNICLFESNYDELMEHITIQHAHELLHCNANVDVAVDEICEETNFIVQDQSVFCVYYRVDIDNFYLSVYRFATNKVPNVYSFIFDVQSGNKLHSFNLKSECLNMSKNWIKLPLKLFDSCLTKKRFAFTINIIKQVISNEH